MKEQDLPAREENRNVSQKTDYKRDLNFYKVFLKRFIPVLNKIGNKKIKLFAWILEHMTWDNKIPYTFRQLSEKSDISYPVVVRTMKELQEVNFLRKNNSGMYMVNPEVIFKGTYQRRCMVLEQFRGLERRCQMPAREYRLLLIQEDIKKLQKQEQIILKQIKEKEAEKEGQIEEQKEDPKEDQIEDQIEDQ